MKKLKVEDVMTRTVVVVREGTPFKDVVRMMLEHRVSGVPVLDGEGRLTGIVTEADLLTLEEGKVEPKHRRSFLEWLVQPGRLAEIEAEAAEVRAADIMTPSVVTARPELTVPEAAKLMLDAQVKRLPVIDEDGKVLGIVSRRDLLQPFLRTDEEIEREIREEVIFRTMWIDPDTIGVEVERGCVRLRGTVERRSVAEILVELVHRVEGVVGVEDELGYRWDDRKVKPRGPFSAPRWSENWARRGA
ncbi:MAG TPA: CBS domain-containing protein [Actinomycetota bacterium]